MLLQIVSRVNPLMIAVHSLYLQSIDRPLVSTVEYLASWVAAGTAASMACIERAIVVSLFTHRRVWVFLALNLLLLAILFTSRSEPQHSNGVDDQNDIANTKLNRKKRRQQCQSLDSGHVKLPKNEDSVEGKMKIAESDGIQEAQYQLTKEELNQRVEAFIAMFRQHLVSDAMEKTLMGDKGVSVKDKCVK